ncbi:hemoglobin/transferrin/lactoferrin receptor protein [Algoriphagus hitonicola]|uniref:Hemoglobin/transferrin/lactoferrin receptor protein n=2 Tax=Algoriphagus hitonicola TaxID=435880 RepID=A0A1I2P9M4_9BACT|nr:hemoglobin/transferrin/lactoferrin receptor protein [Algoriphagus hitonicola]
MLLCMLGWVGFAYAQTLIITDQNTGKLLEGVTLISQSSESVSLSDPSGEVDLSPFAGSKSILISLMGYETEQLSFDQLQNRNFRLALVPTNLQLSEIVISGTKWNQQSANLPIKISSISPETIAFQNPQTAADLLGVSGKVYIQKSQQGGGSPMIRGFATNRLLYVVDGVRMNSAIFRGGNFQNVINLDPFIMEQTEVLFGPGSVIYGSDAIGGVMSFQTRNPTFSQEKNFSVSGNLTSRYSSANQEKTIHADVNLGWKKWGLLTSFSNWDYDHLKQGKNGPDEYLKPFYVERINGSDQVIYQENPGLKQIPSSYSQYNLMQKIRFKPNSKWDFQYGFHRSQTSPYGRYDRHNRIQNNLPRYAEWDYGPQLWQMNLLSIKYTADRGMFDQMSLKASQQQFKESRIDRNFQNPLRTIQEELVDTYAFNWDFHKLMDEKHTLSYGIEWVKNQVSSTGKTEQIETGQTQKGPSRYPNADWSTWGIYLNEELKLTGKANLQAGLRYSRYQVFARFLDEFYPFPFEESELDEGALTGSLGMAIRPSSDWVIQSNFGTAFRAPNVDDLGKVFDSEPGAVTVPNPELRPEYAYSLDFGVAKKIGDLAKIDISTYYTILDHALVRRNFTLNGADSISYQGELSQVQAIQNAAHARVFGLQLGLEMRLSPQFDFTTDLNFQNGKEELNDGSISPSRHAAPLFGVSRLEYKNNLFKGQVYFIYQGERSFENLAFEERNKDEIYAKDQNGNNYAPAWYTANLKASYQFHHNFQAVIGLENLTDQSYRPYSSGISGAGRNLLISLSYKF